MYSCNESGCEEKFDDPAELTVHISYHHYHQKIKDQAKDELKLIESRFNTDIKCPLADLEGINTNINTTTTYSELPIRLICKWCDCGQEFFSAELFYQHVSNHAHRTLDKCYWEECNVILKTVTLQLMREHLRKHTKQKLYACPECGKFLSTKVKFEDHFLRHLPLPDFVADRDCAPTRVKKHDGDIKFDIEEYDIEDGNRIKVFRCTHENCDKAFFTSSLLREHVRIHSTKNQCNLCSFKAKSSSTLESHKLYRHQTERSFECAICLKTFKQGSDLRAHVRRHQRIVEPYRCDKCGFETLNKGGLNTHAKLHDRNHDYMCHICQRVFSRGNNLSRHLKDQHELKLPDGQSRFRYRLIDEGVYLLDTGDDQPIVRPPVSSE